MRRALLLAAALLAGALGACRGTAAPAGVRVEAPGDLTPSFEAVRTALLDARGAAEAGGAEALRSHGARVSTRGLALLQSRPPHDLRRGDAERFLEARAAFGRALVVWTRAAESGDAPGLASALGPLVEAYWAWVDASKGLPPEKAV